MKKLYDGKPNYDIKKEMNKYTLIAEHGGKLVGFIQAAHVSIEFMNSEIGRSAFPGAKKYLEIQDFFVEKQFRKHGIGGMLMRHVLGMAKKNGIRNAMVYSGNSDYASIAKYYERFGFKMWQIFMTKKLSVK